MTPDAIRALHADELPQALAAAGCWPDTLPPMWWQPHLRWDHAMPLLDALHAQGWITSLSWIPSREEGRQGYMEAFGSGQHVGVYYTAESGPEMLCRAVLRAAAPPAAAEDTP